MPERNLTPRYHRERRSLLAAMATLPLCLLTNSLCFMSQIDIPLERHYDPKEKMLLRKERDRLINLEFYKYLHQDYVWIKIPTSHPFLNEIDNWKGFWSNSQEKFIPHIGMEETIPQTHVLLSKELSALGKLTVVYYCHTKNPNRPQHYLPSQVTQVQDIKIPPLYPEIYVIRPELAATFEKSTPQDVFLYIKKLDRVVGERPSVV